MSQVYVYITNLFMEVSLKLQNTFDTHEVVLQGQNHKYSEPQFSMIRFSNTIEFRNLMSFLVGSSNIEINNISIFVYDFLLSSRI